MDTLIAKQENLIELLREKRQAIISHAVTKGLNPDAKMKDSGVEWLGMVPDEWIIKPLKHVSSVNDDVISESTNPETEIEYVDIGSVSVENGIEKSELMKFFDAPSRARRRVLDGDIIVSTVRTYLKAIAPIIKPPSNLVCSTGFAVIRPRKDLIPAYAKYFMQSGYFIDEVIARSVGVSYPAINSSEMICIRMPLPSREDQMIIAAYLDDQTSRIDTLIDKARRSIELAKEHRTALISAAVTGKIDVREVA
jgi:type I restriction enzyme S subunit